MMTAEHGTTSRVPPKAALQPPRALPRGMQSDGPARRPDPPVWRQVKTRPDLPDEITDTPAVSQGWEFAHAKRNACFWNSPGECITGVEIVAIPVTPAIALRVADDPLKEAGKS